MSMAILYLNNWEQVPVTGRWRLNSDKPERTEDLKVKHDSDIIDIIAKMGLAILPDSDPTVVMVHQVLERLLLANELQDRADWKLYVLDAPDIINAGATLTGDIFIFNGLTQLFHEHDESSIATVIGHEVGHVLGSHILKGRSIYSRALILFLVLVPILFLPFMVGVGLSLTWDSRIREIEADYIGLFLMAKASYDIRKAANSYETMRDFSQTKIDEGHLEYM